MSEQLASGGPNPFLSANQFISSQYKSSLRNYHAAVKDKIFMDALALHQVHTDGVLNRETPTPATTGAPIPGYRVRGPVNPSTTGAPMPGTLKNNTATNPTTKASVPSVPVKRSNSKQTAPGTKPKKR